MNTDVILISAVNHIATIALNRPQKRNALNGDVVKALLQALDYFARDDKTRVLIIQGEGEHFCAGADIAWMQKMTMHSLTENEDDAQLLADLMYRLYVFPKPTIVLAHGATLGGGLGLLAACDIAIAAESAIFAFSEVKIGIAPSVVSPYVIAAIGERAAHYYFLTAEKFAADVAVKLGLVHQAVAAEALLSTGMTIAKMILKNNPQALTAAKQLIRRVSKEKISEELAQKTAEHLANLRASADAKEGLSAFLEKRDPKWL